MKMIILSCAGGNKAAGPLQINVLRPMLLIQNTGGID